MVNVSDIRKATNFIDEAHRSIKFMGLVGELGLPLTWAAKRGLQVKALVPAKGGLSEVLVREFNVPKHSVLPIGMQLEDYLRGPPILGSFHVRFVERTRSMTYALIDDETGLIDAPRELGLTEPWVVTEEAAALRLLRDHFEGVWEAPLSDTLDSLVYEDIHRSIVTPDRDHRIIAISEKNWAGVIKELAENPDGLFSLAPRKFEELIAELLARDGFEPRLTPETRDGGRDILAFYATPLGRILYLVECKRYAKNNLVGIGIVRSLYGVVQFERATIGLIVTTSRLSQDARRLKKDLQYQIAAHEYEDLVKWLKQHAQE